MSLKKYCSFLIDGQCFVIDSLQVASVRSMGSLTPIPGSRRDISGLMNIRGDIYLVFDVGMALLGRCQTKIIDQQLILLRHEVHEFFAMSVDLVGDIIDFWEEDFQPPWQREPVEGQHKILPDLAACVSGYTVKNDILVTLLDPMKIAEMVSSEA